MTKGKLIVIEGNDCSGKETQSRWLVQYLNAQMHPASYISFPNYDTPTGKIISEAYLGRGSECWFSEGSCAVDPYVAALYYAADRRYNCSAIRSKLESGENVVIDRYTYSSLAHQGGKLADEVAREQFYQDILELEYNILQLPKPDLVIYLDLPTEYVCLLQQTRTTLPDDHEKNLNHLKQAHNTYLELSKKYHFKMINCLKDDNAPVAFGNVKTKEEIHQEVINIVNQVI